MKARWKRDRETIAVNGTSVRTIGKISRRCRLYRFIEFSIEIQKQSMDKLSNNCSLDVILPVSSRWDKVKRQMTDYQDTAFPPIVSRFLPRVLTGTRTCAM